MKTTIIYLLLIVSANLFFAQNQSVYTRYTLGDYAPLFSARNLVLGDASAFADYNSLGSSNPAAWNAINLSRVEGGFIFSQSFQKDVNSEGKFFDSKFSGIRFAIPIQRDYGIVFALFLEPVKFINYNVEKNYTSEQFDDYKLNYKGEGSISKIGFGLTYRLPFGVALGSTFDYYLGTSYYSSTIDFPEFSQYVDATFKYRNKYHGLGFTLGAITNDFAEIFNSEILTGLNFSASVKYLAKVYVDTSLVLHSKYDEITMPGSQYVVNIPNDYSFGIKIDFLKMFTVVSDYSFSNRTKFNSEQNGELVDRMKFSLGCEYFDRANKRRTFWRNVPLRIGFATEKLQYSIEGKLIYSYILSIGAGIPINEKNIVDLSLSFGEKGPNDGTLIQEKFIRFGISLSLGEQWFIRKGYK